MGLTKTVESPSAKSTSNVGFKVTFIYGLEHFTHPPIILTGRKG